MKTSKPEMKSETRARLNELYVMLRRGRVTKREIQAQFGVCERTARDMVSTISKRCPVIATSDNNGYFIATGSEHMEDIEHTWKEIDSRIEELQARREPLIEAHRKLKGE